MTQSTRELAGPALRYATGVALAHILAAAEVIFIVAALRRETTDAARHTFEGNSTVIVMATVLVTILAVAVASVLNILPSLRWFVAGQQPTPQQRDRALAIPSRQSRLLVAVWIAGGAAIIAGNPRALLPALVLSAPAVFFGATAAVLASLLLTMHTLRHIMAAAHPGEATRDTAPGVMARLINVWVLCSAMPSLGIASLIAIRARGWIIDESASLEIPVLVLLTAAVVWGLRAMILVSRSISDPVRDVVKAMADVEHGNLDHTVDVYEQSEIGRLQTGFNQMVAGLQERERLRDLFGRHVGGDVVHLLEQHDRTLYRDVRDAAILFVDLTGSTRLAATRPPQEVADVLNSFFQAAVRVVDHHHGFVNKFQGDAMLAIFGAPIRRPSAASDALAAARDLGCRLRRLRDVDFGIGVSSGPVFAGYIGALSRFEYTVVGDAVNEAARLADRAKAEPDRTLCSGNVIAGCDDDERARWHRIGAELLRGRAAATQLYAPD